MNNISKHLIRNLNFATSELTTLCEKAAKGGLDNDVLPNLISDSDTSRFGLLNKLNNNKWIGKGYDAKMANIYASTLKIFVLSKRITVKDLKELAAGEVSDQLAQHYEALIESAERKVSAWMTMQRNLIEDDKSTKGNIFGIE